MDEEEKMDETKCYAQGMLRFERGDYDGAIDFCTKGISMTQYEYLLGLLYDLRGSSHIKNQNETQGINDIKKAADYGNEYALEKLIKVGINYTPKKPSSSSAQNSSGSSSSSYTPSSSYDDDDDDTSASSYDDDDDDTSASSYVEQRNGFVSFLFGLVGAVGVFGTAYYILAKLHLNFFINLALYFIVPIAALIITYSAWRNRKYILFFIMLALSVPGYIGLTGEIRSPKSTQTTQTAITQQADIINNVNFRKDPSTGDNIIRQLKKGDTVTLTGEVLGGWTQITHNGDTGWVSTEFLKIYGK